MYFKVTDKRDGTYWIMESGTFKALRKDLISYKWNPWNSLYADPCLWDHVTVTNITKLIHDA